MAHQKLKRRREGDPPFFFSCVKSHIVRMYNLWSDAIIRETNESTHVWDTLPLKANPRIYIYIYILLNKKEIFGMGLSTPRHMTTIGNTTCTTQALLKLLLEYNSIGPHHASSTY